MKTKQTLRLSLVTAAVLVVLLCLIAVLALNVSPFAAKAETTTAGPLTVPDGYVSGQYEGWQYEGLEYSELEARLEDPATSGRYFSIADDYHGTVTVSNVDKPSVGACSTHTSITPNVYQAYTVTLSWAPDGDYEGGTQAFNIMIDKCHIKASAFNSSSTHVYGNLPNFDPAFTPKSGDTVELSKWYYQADGETRINDFESEIYDAGSYKMEVAINGGETADHSDAADYYVLDQSWYDYTITPRPITPAFKWNNMLVNNTAIIGYTGSNIALTKTNTDGIAGVSFTVDQWQYNSTEYVEDEDVMAVGMYKVVSADVALVAGNDAPQGFNINNYCLDGGFNSFTFNIGKRALELNWDAEAVFGYNGSAQVRQATYTVKMDPNFNDQELVSSDALPELQITGDETDIGNYTATASLSSADAVNFDLYVNGSNVGSSTTKSFSIIKGNVGVNITQKNGAHLYYANFDVTDFDDIFEVTFTHTGENNVNFMIDTSSWKITDPNDGEWAGVTSISALYDAQTSGKNPGRQYRVSVRLSLLTQVTDQYAVAVPGVTYYSDEFGQNQVDSVEPGVTEVYGKYYYWESDLYESNSTTGEFLFDYEKAPVYARPTTASYDYDGENHLPTITYKLFDPINGQDATFCVFPTNDSECDVGTYPLTALIKDDYGYDDCYQFIVDSSFTINAVDLGGTLAQSNVLTYTGNDLTATASGLTSTAGQAITITYCDEEGGTYGAMPTFVTAGNHTVYYKATAPNHNQKSGSFTVTIGDATITGTLAQTNSLTYDGTAKTATAGGLATVDGSEITITYAITEGGSYGAMPEFTNADTYEVFYKANATYHAEKTGSFFVAVGQFEVELAWSNDDLTYDGTKQLPVATVSNKPANGEAVTVTVTGEQTDASENQYTATATALSSSNYKLPANAEHKFSIGQFEVTLAWSNDDLTYNKTAQKPTATVSNKPANGEAVTVTVTGEQTNARAEAYTATATALSSDNYKLPAEVTHSFTISAKEITVSGLTVADRAYNKSTVAIVITTGATFAENDVEDGDIVTVDSADGEFENANVGENKTVTISNIVLSNANYAVKAGSQTQTNATITAKEITVSGLTVADRDYNASAVATVITTGATFAENDVEDGDTVTVTSADGTFADANVEVDEEDETVVIAKTVTISNIVLSNTNYAVKAGSQTSTTAKINPLAISLDLYVDDEVATEKVEITYDGDAHTFVVKAAGLDADVIIFSEDSLTDVQGSTEFVIPAQFLQADGSEYYNYKLVSAFNVPDYAIVPRLVTVTGIVGVDKIYDGNEEATLSFANVEISNVVLGEELVVTSATATFANANAGQNKTISISDIILSGVEETEAYNYEVKNDSQTEATATITAKTVELVWSNTEIGYVGASNEYKPQADVKPSSIVADDEVNVTTITGGVHYATTDGQAIATALNNENYQLPANATCAFVVNKAPLTVNISNKESYYGDAPQVVSYTLGSDIYDPEGDIFTVSHSVTASTGVGNYAITLTPANNQIAASYDITAPDGTYSVTARPITVTYEGEVESMEYGAADSAWEALLDRMVKNGCYLASTDTVATAAGVANLVNVYFNTKPDGSDLEDYDFEELVNAGAGKYYMIVDGDDGNYDVTVNLGNKAYIEITKAAYDMSGIGFANDTVEYDGQAHSLTITGTLPTGLDGIKVTVGYSGSATTVADGAVTVTATFATTSTNYEVPAAMQATITIIRATYSTTANITDWTYGENANAPDVTTNPEGGNASYLYKVQGADDDTYTDTVPTNAGDYTVKATIAETANYNSASATADFSIAKAAAAYTPAQGNNLTYSGVAQALISAGTTSDGHFEYSLDGTNFANEIPTAINADTYTVYYKVVGDENHSDIEGLSINVVIAPKLIRVKNVNTAKIAVQTGETKEGVQNWDYMSYQLEALEAAVELSDGYTLAGDDVLSEVIVINTMGDPEKPWIEVGDQRFVVDVVDTNYAFDLDGTDPTDEGCDFDEFAFVTFSRYQIFVEPVDQTVVYSNSDNFDANAYNIYQLVYSWDATNNKVVSERRYASATNKIDPQDPNSPTELEYYKSCVIGGLTRAAGNSVGTYAIDIEISFPDPGTLPVAPVAPEVANYETIEEYQAAVQAYQAALQAYGAAISEFFEKAFPYYNYEIIYAEEDAATYTITKRAITVTVNNVTSTYGEFVAPTYTVAPAIATGDEESDVFVVTTKASATADVGAYDIKVEDKFNKNYAVTGINATYTIIEKEAEASEDGTVEYDKKIDQSTAAVTGADLTSLFSKAAADESATKELKVEVGSSNVVFDAAAIAAIAASEGKVVFTFNAKSAEELTSDELNGKYKGAQMLINVSLDGATFENGKAVVSVAFDGKAPTGKEVRVSYVDENGKRKAMKTNYADGVLSFETNHFSDYIVTYELTAGTIAGIAVACVVFVAACVVAVLFLLKKKGGKKGADTTTTAAEAVAE